MKQLSRLLLTLALALGLAVPAFADVITPGRAIALEFQRRLPLILIVAALVLTAALVRTFTKKK